MRFRAASVLVLIAGCADVLGADFGGASVDAGSGGSGDVDAAGGSGLVGGAGGTSGVGGTGGLGGTGGASGSGGTGGAVCDAGSTKPCYEGAAATDGVGVCTAGVSTCVNGAAFGACEGQVLPVAADCTLDAFDVDCDGKTGAHLWSHRLGSGALQRVSASDVDATGALVMTGYSWGPMTLSATVSVPSEMFLIKLDPSGNVAWGKGWDPYGSQGVSVAAAPSGDVTVAGLIGGPADFGGGVLPAVPNVGNPVLATFEADGDHLASRLAPALVGVVEPCTTDPGKLLVAGTFSGTLVWPDAAPLGATSAGEAFIALLAPDLDALWTRSYGPNVEPRRLAMDSQGNILLAGILHGYADLGGGSLGDGTMLGFVAKLDSAGNHLWSHALGAAPQYYGNLGLAVAADGSVWVATPFAGTMQAGSTVLTSAGEHDVAVIRYAAGGAALSARRFGGPGFDVCWDAAVDSSGSLIVSGTFNTTIDAGSCNVTAQTCALPGACSDAFLLKLEPSGEPMWLHAFGDGIDQTGDNWFGETFVGVDVGPGDSILGVGWFSGSVDWSGGTSVPLVDAGNYDLFAALFAP